MYYESESMMIKILRPRPFSRNGLLITCSTTVIVQRAHALPDTIHTSANVSTHSVTGGKKRDRTKQKQRIKPLHTFKGIVYLVEYESLDFSSYLCCQR